MNNGIIYPRTSGLAITTTKLIRRIREMEVYSEILPLIILEEIKSKNPWWNYPEVRVL